MAGKVKTPLTVERLKEVLFYDPDTGVFTRNKGSGNHIHRHGSVAGTLKKTGGNAGYRYIQIDNICYLAHRLAWLYVYGEWPNGQIDHINATRDDNRIANIREATNSTNQHNRKDLLRKDGTRKGIFFNPRNGKWKAMIFRENKQKSLGWFASETEAHAVYMAAKEAHIEALAKKGIAADESGLPG